MAAGIRKLRAMPRERRVRGKRNGVANWFGGQRAVQL